MEQKIISYFVTKIAEFCCAYQQTINIIFKGSFASKLNQTSSRDWNDVDLIFTTNTKISTRKKFIHFLVESGLECFYNDENLVKFWLNNKIIEFILLENLPPKFTNQIAPHIYVIKEQFNILGKITMFAYVTSSVYTHDAKKKLANLYDDLSVVNMEIKIDQQIEQFLYKAFYNSFLISFHYNYLFIPIFDFLKNLEQHQIQFDKKWKPLFNFWYKLKKYYDFLAHLDNLLHLFVKNKTEILTFSTIPSISGWEKQLFSYFDNQYQNKMVEKNLVITGPNNNTLFIAHADEVGGIWINHKIYNVGTINWTNGFFNIYHPNGTILAKNIAGTKEEHHVYSKEKNWKINQPTLKLTKDLKTNHNPLLILPNTESDYNSFYWKMRNGDNRLNILILYLLKNKIKASLMLTSSKEIGLQGIKGVKTKQIIEQYANIVNLEVTKFEQWEIDGLLIKITDPFTAVNLKEIEKTKSLLEQLNIPYQLFFCSNSTDPNEIQYWKHAVTVGIPADQVHTMQTTVNLINLVYLSVFVHQYDKKFS